MFWLLEVLQNGGDVVKLFDKVTPKSEVSKLSRHAVFYASILRLRSPLSKLAKWKERSGPYSSRKEAARALIMRATELASDCNFGSSLPDLETGRLTGAVCGLWEIRITEI